MFASYKSNIILQLHFNCLKDFVPNINSKDKFLLSLEVQYIFRSATSQFLAFFFLMGELFSYLTVESIWIIRRALQVGLQKMEGERWLLRGQLQRQWPPQGSPQGISYVDIHGKDVANMSLNFSKSLLHLCTVGGKLHQMMPCPWSK